MTRIPRPCAASRSSRSAASPPSSGSTDQVVVGVVAVVRGRREDRCQVERGDAEVLEIAEVLDDPEQVTALEPVHRRRGVPGLEGAGASKTRSLRRTGPERSRRRPRPGPRPAYRRSRAPARRLGAMAPIRCPPVACRRWRPPCRSSARRAQPWCPRRSSFAVPPSGRRRHRRAAAVPPTGMCGPAVTPAPAAPGGMAERLLRSVRAQLRRFRRRRHRRSARADAEARLPQRRQPVDDDDLGVTALWLMPVAESPSYHGYDVIDYKRIGTTAARTTSTPTGLPGS